MAKPPVLLPNIEELTLELIEWIKQGENFFLKDFTSQKGITFTAFELSLQKSVPAYKNYEIALDMIEAKLNKMLLDGKKYSPTNIQFLLKNLFDFQDKGSKAKSKNVRVDQKNLAELRKKFFEKNKEV
ncbi:MAG: hypothetical protein EHM58_19400 [Ignavibacteriae bacterium]|nr:MAG: hypothetical protein EHM58_19400 [Ignavibacteriota bacterium]